MERFADIDIAESRNDPLIQKQRLDWGFPAAKLIAQGFGADFSRLGTQFAYRSPIVELSGRKEIDGAEPTGIVEHDHELLVRLEKEMVVRAELIRIDAPLARHAEVEDHRVAAVGVDQPIFAAAAEASDSRAGHPLAEPFRKRPPEIRAARLYAPQFAAEKNLLKPAYGGFDFRKFWHSADMAKVVAAS